MFTVIKNKKIYTSLYLYRDSETPIKKAVEEVIKTIDLLTGVKITSHYIDNLESVSNAIILTTFDKLDKKLFKDDYNYLLGTDGFAVRNYLGNLYIISHTAGGVFFGVHDILEKNAEIIWTRAKRGEEVSYTPSNDLVINTDNYREKPDFIYRGWNTVGEGEDGHHHDLGTMICFAKNKNNTKFEIYLDKFADYGIDVQGLYDPTIQDYSSLILSNPEYFMIEENGLPRKNQGELSFLNYYNYEVAVLVANRIMDLFKRKPDTINKRIYIGTPDDEYFRMVDGDKIISNLPFTTDDGFTVNPTDIDYRSCVFYNFINRVVKIVCKSYPTATFMTLGYLYADDCPRCFVDERIAVGFCPIGIDEHTPYEENTTKSGNILFSKLKQWCEKIPNVSLYLYWQSLQRGYPRPLAKTVQKNLRYFKKLGIKHIISEGYLDASNHLGKDEKFDLNEMYIWQMNKLFWNIEEDLDVLTEKYCRLVYGKAYKDMIDFYNLIQSGWDKSDIFVTWSTGNDLYIKQCILKAGLDKPIINALENALQKDLLPSSRRRIQSIYTQIKTLIDNYLTLSSEIATFSYCDKGEKYILSSEQLAVEENKDSVWNRSKKLKLFKNIVSMQDYDINARLNVRLLYDEERIYLGFQVFDDKLTAVTGINEAGLPIVMREDGSVLNSYAETYIGGNVDLDREYFGLITGFLQVEEQKGFYINDGAPSRIEQPKGYREAFFVHDDENPKKRYYFHVQSLTFADLGTDVNNAKLYGSFIYFTNRYKMCGWKGNGLWCKPNFEEFILENKEKDNA